MQLYFFLPLSDRIHLPHSGLHKAALMYENACCSFVYWHCRLDSSIKSNQACSKPVTEFSNEWHFLNTWLSSWHVFLKVSVLINMASFGKPNKAWHSTPSPEHGPLVMSLLVCLTWILPHVKAAVPIEQSRMFWVLYCVINQVQDQTHPFNPFWKWMRL